MSFAAHSVPREPDLFQAAEDDLRVAESRAALARAEASLETARVRYMRSPHGGHGQRLRDFQEATHQALKAALALRQALAARL